MGVSRVFQIHHIDREVGLPIGLEQFGEIARSLRMGEEGDGVERFLLNFAGIGVPQVATYKKL